MVVLKENLRMKLFFTSLFECLRNSKRILHIVVFVICICFSAYQLVGCLNKLQQPPVSTHYRFAINETLNYPAVTVCRNPPYKYDVLKHYNLGQQNSSVEHTSNWQHFPFDRATLQQVWDNATYRQDEVIKLYGLHGESANAEIVQNYYFFHGRCFTFRPRVGSTKPWPNSGWSILLQHVDKNQGNNPKYIGNAIRNEVDGFHVYVHEVREPWTENLAQTKYIMNYMYVEVGEDIELKLNADEFKGISTGRRPCLSDINYSRYKCIEQRWWRNISKEAGCTVPWMRDVVGFPHCNKYEPLKNLMYSYMNFTDIDDYNCPMHPCNITSYRLQVQKRDPFLKPYTQIYVYYTTKLVTVMEELPGYDANAFIADMGGSLGFFLGLSVIGAIRLVEKTWSVVVCLAKPKKGEKEGEGAENEAEKEKEKS